MNLEAINGESANSESLEVIVAIAETSDETCNKITRTLTSLSNLRGVEPLPEESLELPYRL